MESCSSWLPGTLPYDSVSAGHIVRTDRRSGNHAMDGARHGCVHDTVHNGRIGSMES